MDRQRPRRAGFTLIEVLVVIVIIGILIALLVPAVTAAFRKGKEAQVAAEMNNMAAALISFRDKFGDYPPSRLYCSETGYYPANNVLAQRSLLYLQKFWPRMALSTSGAVTSMPGGYYDFNNNNSKETTAYILQGPECLTFFLGGMPTLSTGTAGNPQYSLVGFGRNPLNPFLTYSPSNTVASNRTPPFFPFVSGRLDDTENLGGTANNIPSYLDPLGSLADSASLAASDKRPYAYFCSYGSNAYDPGDYECSYEKDEAGSVDFVQNFTTAYATATSYYAANPYTTGLPVPGGTSVASFQNPTSFQLISAGQDREWGLGGEYNKSAPNPLPVPASGYASGSTSSPRIRERDNITNFSGGRLD